MQRSDDQKKKVKKDIKTSSLKTIKIRFQSSPNKETDFYVPKSRIFYTLRKNNNRKTPPRFEK